MKTSRRQFIEAGAALLAAAGSGCVTRIAETAAEKRWYKGMLHCHSYWSDGRAFPEQMVAAYRQLGYDFMSLTDHNRLSMHRDEWREVVAESKDWPPKVTRDLLENARQRFPWLRVRKNAQGNDEARLTPYAELLEHFNAPGRFLLIPGCEITRGTGDWSTGRQLHMNIIGVTEVIPSARHSGLVQGVFSDLTPAKLIRATREECELQAKAEGNPPTVFTLDHPQWPYYDVLPSDLIKNPEVRFFEVCNGGAQMDSIPELQRCEGHDNDRFWDVVNAFRARAGEPLLYATAVDDAHWAAFSGVPVAESCFTGDGYIRVRSAALTAPALFAAMDRGDFYASTGLDLEDVAFDGRTLRVRVPADESAACRVKFFVTKRDFDDRIVKTVKIEKTEKTPYARTVPIYSDEIGQMAKEVSGSRGKSLEASYTLASDDLYVRARIESERPSPWVLWHKKMSPHPIHAKFATAWTQPYVAK